MGGEESLGPGGLKPLCKPGQAAESLSAGPPASNTNQAYE